MGSGAITLLGLPPFVGVGFVARRIFKEALGGYARERVSGEGFGDFIHRTGAGAGACQS